MDVDEILREARRSARMTQAELGRRLGITQAAVAKLERRDSNPTIETLDRALRATGHRLALHSEIWRPGVDESLIRQQLERRPAQRVRLIESMYREGHRLARAGRMSRGERP